MTGLKGRRSSRRGRGRGRGRGGDKATEEALPRSCHQSENTMSEKSTSDEDYPFTPCSYQTRRSSSVLRSIRKTPFHSSSLKPAMRILNEKPPDEPLPSANRDIEMPELHHYVTSSQPTVAEDVVCQNTAEKDVDMSVSTRSPTWSASASMHLVPLDCRENAYVIQPEKGTTTNNVDINSQCLSASHSLNITEYAKRLQDDIDDDPEEVESDFNPAFDSVYGHKVKTELAPLLRAIFERYGDITEGSHVKSPNILSFFLERICDIYQKLERMNFFDVTCIELNGWLDEVRDLEHEKMNVRWLLERIEHISETKISILEYGSVKQEGEKYDASIGSLEQELSDLQQKISAKEGELVEMRAKAEESKKMTSKIRNGVNTLRKQTLVDGLL